jgi:hypothetical protein
VRVVEYGPEQRTLIGALLGAVTSQKRDLLLNRREPLYIGRPG